ncbi:MAG: site-specific integrase [Candidatus Melainabacteria bacterium]|nr:site-specific integrase [Candidatus Melainabacteria bacterium]
MPGQAKVLSKENIEAVFKILDNTRDKTIFALGIYTGMRIGEIIRLQQESVYTTDGGIRYQIVVKRLKKKNTTYSDIPVHPKLRSLLKEYKQIVRDDMFLFPSSESVSGHISRARAHDILAGAFETLKLDGASTHSMRRSCLTFMSRIGIPLRTVQEISGHSNLSQLQAYLEVDEEDKHRAINLLKY